MPALAHIVSSLRRQRLMPALVTLQTAFASAILANVLFLFWQQLEPMTIPDGIAAHQVLVVDGLIANGAWGSAQIQAGAQRLRALPGVRAVSASMGVPMRESMKLDFPVSAKNGPSADVNAYAGEGLAQALGLRLVQGRDFQNDEYFNFDLSTDEPPSLMPVIITQSLADHLLPGGHALGARLDMGHEKKIQLVVVGVVAHLLRYEMGDINDGKAEFALLMPARVTGTPILQYIVRADAAQRDVVEAAIPAVLHDEFSAAALPGTEPQVDSYERLRRDAFQPRRAALWLLGTVCAVVALVTTLGIASLTAYWVEQRNHQIGIRRALGATRAHILHHFQVENLLLAGLGAVLGMPFALAANQYLMHYYELSRLPLAWLPAGAAFMLLLGQAAVYAPARRAASIPPAVATRSV